MASDIRSAQDLAEKVNMSLPLHLNAYDVEHNKEFVKLLTALSKHLTDTGVSRDVEKDRIQAEETLKQEKLAYLQLHLLHLELQEFIMDYEIDSHDIAPSTDTKQFYDAVKHCLYSAEVCNYLDCDLTTKGETSNTALLGLTKEDINRNNPHRKQLNSIEHRLIPKLEERLRNKCETLVTYHQPQKQSGSSELSFAKSTQLPSMLERECCVLKEEKKQLRQDKAKRDRKFWQYYQSLIEWSNVLSEVIKKHGLKSKMSENIIVTNWLNARCQAVCCRINCLEADVLCDTYTKESVDALKQIKYHMNHAINDCEKELGRLTQAVQAYESLGMGFDKLVKEFHALQEAIDSQRWALAELKPNMDRN
ncbi:HAUS augmin-like complex subunit 4 [Glandiceps talaboti]